MSCERDGELIAGPALLQLGVDDRRAVRRDAQRREEDDVLQRDGLAADFFPERGDGDFEMGRAGQERVAAVEMMLGEDPVALDAERAGVDRARGRVEIDALEQADDGTARGVVGIPAWARPCRSPPTGPSR